MPTLKARIGGAWVAVGGASASEVEVSATDPIAANPQAEMWYDTADTGISLPNGPRGYVGHAIGPASDYSTTSATAVVVPGTSVTFTAAANRRYKTTINFNLTISSIANQPTVGVCDQFAGFVINGGGYRSAIYGSAGATVVIQLTSIETGLSGSITRALAVTASASGTTTVVGSFSRLLLVLVEDIGGV